MRVAKTYIDLDGKRIALDALDAEERRLLARLRRRARIHPDWTNFENFWLREVAGFYDARGLRRTKLGERRCIGSPRISEIVWDSRRV